MVAKLGLDTSEYDKGLDEAGKSGKSFGSKIGGVLKTGAKVAGAGLAATATAAVAFGKASIDAGKKFDASMSQVAAISGATGQDLADLREKAQEMGAKTKFSASEAADAFTYMAMAGWKSGDMLDGIEGLMNLAAASGEDLATTSDIVTDALTAFGLKAQDSGHFADILAAASSNANTNVGMMGETFKYAAPIAGALGYSAEDTAIAIGLMANAGIKSSQAGTSLRTIMTSLTGEVKLTGKAFGEAVVQTTNADGSMREFSSIISDLRYYWKDLTEAERASAAEALVGKNAMSGFLAIMNAGEEDVAKLADAVWECDDAALNMANTMQDNLAGDITIFKSALEGAQIALSDVLTPALRDFVQWGTETVARLTEAFKEDGLAGVISEVGSMFGDFLSSLPGKAAEAISGLVDSISAYLNEHLPQAGAAFDGFVGAVQTAFQAVSDFWENTLKPAFIAIYDYVAVTLVPALEQEWTRFSDVVGLAFDAIKGFWDSVLYPVFKGIMDMIETKVKPAFENNWPKIQDVVERVFNTIENIWQTILKPVFEGIRDFMVNTLFPAFQTVWEQGIQPLIEAVFDVIVASWEDVLYPAFVAIDDFLNNTLLPTFKTVWEQNVQPVVENVFTAIEGFWNSILKPAFDAIVDFLENTMVPIYQNVFETTIQPLVESVFNAIQGFWENTLRPAFEAIDSFLNDTLWPTFETVWQNNIQPLVDTVFTAIKGFWDNVLHPVFEAIGSALEGTGTTWQEVFDLLSSKADTVFSAINGFMNTHLKPVFDWINQTFTPVFAAVQDAIGALGSWLSDVFTGNWENAWNGIVNGFGSIWGKITGLLSGPINAVIDMINGMIGAVEGAINSVVRGINKALSIKIPAKTFNIFGQEFGFPGWSWSANLSTVSWGRIAHVGGGGKSWGGSGSRFAEGGWLTDGWGYVGEFGPERLDVYNGVATVTPVDSNPYAGLESAIERAVADRLDTIIEKISERMNVYMDSGALVGSIAPEMNDELERITAWSGGGRA